MYINIYIQMSYNIFACSCIAEHSKKINFVREKNCISSSDVPPPSASLTHSRHVH